MNARAILEGARLHERRDPVYTSTAIASALFPLSIVWWLIDFFRPSICPSADE